MPVHVLLLLHVLDLSAAAAASGPISASEGATLRRSLGLGHDTECIEPPPPLRGDLSSRRAPTNHVKYLGLDGLTDATTSSWTNLGFIRPSPRETDSLMEGRGMVNETLLDEYVEAGYDIFLSMQTVTDKILRSHSPEQWATAWTGPNATVGGLWNRSVAKLAAQKKLIGVYFGDELLGGGLAVSNLTALFKLVKAVWPEAITYYNEEWTPINAPAWRDSEGVPFGKVPDSLDWISYDF